MDYAAFYKKKTPVSARLFAKSARLHVNGVSHNIRYYAPYPFITRLSAGKNLVDVDSNKYTDYWMGHWALILGHRPKAVGDALKKQLELGWMYGTVNEQTLLLSDLISGAIPAAEKIRYVTSGTEAAMYAVRLARSVTARRIIAKVDGGWHGYTSDLLKTVNWPFSEPESSGLTDARNIISIPYNDTESALAILQRHKKNLAGVIVEPVLGGGGCIPASGDYLKSIQEFCKSNGSLFMLDEIVTGFRFRFGCLYGELGLEPDLVTLGKIVGGGMPIGVLCGADEIMAYTDTSGKKKSERSYVGGGTFSANPMSMTAGLATLRRLKSGVVHSKINTLGDYTRRELSRVLDRNAIVTGRGSLFMTHFTTDHSEITNAAQAAQCDVAALHRYHFNMIARHGIFFLPGKLGAISNSHTKQDIRNMLTASKDVTG